MVKAHTIKFKDNPEQNYDILIGKDILPIVLEYVKGNISDKRQAIVTDKNVVDAGHLKRLDPKGEIPTFVVKPDRNKGVESKKNVKTYGEILDFLDENKFEKKDTLICLGGGVIGDMGGFVACTYKSGKMTHIQVPTTTLSQADSSVGGKCAINSIVSKNAAGDFYQPHFVVQDIMSLETLDNRNFKSGLVESIKHGLILKESYLTFLESNIEAILNKDKSLLEEIAYQNVKLKGSVVELDPNEENYRRSLNFGHTIGHAIEIVSNFKIYHGEAVQLGILAALHISHVQNCLPEEEFERAQEFLTQKMDLPSKVPIYIDRDKVEKKIGQ